jgi:hypothetical protein
MGLKMLPYYLYVYFYRLNKLYNANLARYCRVSVGIEIQKFA